MISPNTLSLVDTAKEISKISVVYKHGWYKPRVFNHPRYGMVLEYLPPSVQLHKRIKEITKHLHCVSNRTSKYVLLTIDKTQ